jgi:hypothetical protein
MPNISGGVPMSMYYELYREHIYEYELYIRNLLWFGISWHTGFMTYDF